MAHSIDMDHIKSLPVEQRLELIDEIWDSIADEDDVELSDEIKRELDRRLADDDAHPEAALPWAEFQERMRSRS